MTFVAPTFVAPTFVAKGSEVEVLPALRALLADADEALLCSAFVDQRGMLLLDKELTRLGDRARLVATSVFGGGRTLSALDLAAGRGTRCRVLNPSRGTFHPKVIIARSGGEDVALVGSANLTSGLVVNVEAGVIVTGDAAVRAAAEGWWDAGTDLDRVHGAREQDVLEQDLWQLLRDTFVAGDVVHTISGAKPNTITAMDRTGLLVSTARSAAGGLGPQLVEPRMLQLAWDVLRADGVLTNRQLLDDLRVHRSSFVCATLAQLPGVEVVSTRPIALRWTGDASASTPPSLSMAAEPTPGYDAPPS